MHDSASPLPAHAKSPDKVGRQSQGRVHIPVRSSGSGSLAETARNREFLVGATQGTSKIGQIGGVHFFRFHGIIPFSPACRNPLRAFLARERVL